MRAEVVDALGGVPIVEEFADPTGDDVAQVVAAPLNPSDLMVVAGRASSGSTRCAVRAGGAQPAGGGAG